MRTSYENSLRIRIPNTGDCTAKPPHLDKGRHEAHLDAVPLDKGVLVLLPELHDVRHVELVEGCEHGVGVLRLLQPGRDLLSHSVHLHPTIV